MMSIMIGQHPILRRSDHVSMLVFPVTKQYFIAVCASITHANPLSLILLGSFAYALARVFPQLRFMRALRPRFPAVALLACRSRLSYVVLLVGQSDNFYRWPLYFLRRFPGRLFFFRPPY